MSKKREAPTARHNRESKICSTSLYHSVFDEVKEKVSTTEAARYYGYEPNRAGFVCCPFHGEKTPSLKLFDDGFYCFGCGAGGSVIDFVGKLFSLDPLGAVRRMDQDFRLGLPLDRPPTSEEQEAVQARRRVADAKKLFTDWRDQMLSQINSAIRTANTADYKNLTEADALAIRNRETLEYWGDLLSGGSLDEQMAIFRDREGVQRLCQTILSSTPTKSQVA